MKNKVLIFLSLLFAVSFAFFSCEEQEKKVSFDVQEMPSIPLEGELLEEELLAPCLILI